MKGKYTFRRTKNQIKRKGTNINKLYNKKIHNKYIDMGYTVLTFIVNRHMTITQSLLSRLRLDLLNSDTPWGKVSKLFMVDIKINLNKVNTSKGILIRMGSGKAKIKHKSIFVTKGTVIIELVKTAKIMNNLDLLFFKFLRKYPFLSTKLYK